MARRVLYPSGGIPPLAPPSNLGWQDNNTAVVASRALAGAVVLFGAFSGWMPFPPPASPDNGTPNWQTISPEVITKPFSPAKQQYVAHNNFSVPSAPTPHGWEGQQYDYRYAKPFPASAQQFFFSFQPFGIVTSSSPNGWNGYQLDYLFAKPFPVASQQFPESFQPRGTITSTTPQGWQGQQLDYQFVRPFPPKEQVFLALGPEHVPIPSDVEGWFGTQLEYRFAKPLHASEQQYSNFQPAGFVKTTFLDGWRGTQYEYRFRKPISAALHQFLTLDPEIISNSLDFQHYPQPPVLFAKPFPVALQVFSVWDLVGDVPLFFPPGAGKRKDFPSYIPQPPYEAKPNKPYRPVWDKPREGKVEQHPTPTPPGPPPLPPASLFGAAAPPTPPANSLALPDFKHLVPPNPQAFDHHMRDVQDMSDVFNLLRAMGIIKDQEDS